MVILIYFIESGLTIGGDFFLTVAFVHLSVFVFLSVQNKLGCPDLNRISELYSMHKSIHLCTYYNELDIFSLVFDSGVLLVS